MSKKTILKSKKLAKQAVKLAKQRNIVEKSRKRCRNRLSAIIFTLPNTIDHLNEKAPSSWYWLIQTRLQHWNLTEMDKMVVLLVLRLLMLTFYDCYYHWLLLLVRFSFTNTAMINYSDYKDNDRLVPINTCDHVDIISIRDQCW